MGVSAMSEVEAVTEGDSKSPQLRSGSPPRAVADALSQNEQQLCDNFAAAADLHTDGVWMFGYGSLIWRPDMDYVERHRGFCRGFVRRFWQLSPDHRGTPEVMGRVCTMIPSSLAGICAQDPSAWVHGDVFRLAPQAAAVTVAKLCHRERAGYDAFLVPVQCEDGQVRHAWAFTAGPENPFYADAESESYTAAVIGQAVGPSGSNQEYYLRLLHAMRERGVQDAHMEAIWTCLASTHPSAVELAERIAAEAAVVPVGPGTQELSCECGMCAGVRGGKGQEIKADREQLRIEQPGQATVAVS